MVLGFFVFRITMADASLTPMTELEAVNEMLSGIGESPMASLDQTTQVADAQIALSLLRKESRALQTKGWDWNTEECYRLTPDSNGNILLPSNTLKVDPTDPNDDFVYRAGKLWDRKNKTDQFAAAVTLDIVFAYEFEELPETAREYIAMVAARKFENRMQGDVTDNSINSKDELLAWAALLQEECDNADLNLLNNSSTIVRYKRWR